MSHINVKRRHIKEGIRKDPFVYSRNKVTAMENNIRVVDSFIFFNEVDMILLRLKELDEVVDNFVIIESTHTFTGNEKKSFFNENRSLFKGYEDKIIHIINQSSCSSNPWDNEREQRNAIKKGIDQLNLHDEDIIIISDVDEIPDANAIKKLKEEGVDCNRALNMDCYWYNFTCKSTRFWHQGRVVNFKNFKFSTPEEIRKKPALLIHPGGWHLSYFGGVGFIQNKIKNISHQEYNTPEIVSRENIENSIKKGIDFLGRGDDWRHQYEYIALEDNEYLPKNYQLLT